MLYGKPEITKDMGSKAFLEYYYLESEMADFCRKNGMDPLGNRKDLKDRIVSFLSGGKMPTPKFILKPEVDSSIITDDMPVENFFTYEQRHIDYFEDAIGLEFIPHEDFIIWLEENPGKTYGEAVDFWYLIHDSLS